MEATPATRPHAAAPSEGKARGTDLSPESRPGVPMHADPHATGERPAPQAGGERHLRRAGLEAATPVFGTAQPPRGASGLIRRAAYRIPEHYARHWLLLMLADRVDVVEDRIGPRLADPIRQAGLEGVADRVQKNPLAAVAGAVVGAWALKHLLD